jgi:hypothetical protein
MNKQLFKKKVREQWDLAMNERIDARNVLDLRLYIDNCLDGIYNDTQLDELYDYLEKYKVDWFIDIYENIHGENNAVFTDHTIFASDIPDDLESKLLNMSTEEFVRWMNSEFLDPHEHGHYCKIHEMTDDNYWTTYLRPLGCDIAWGVANGVNRGCFSKTEQYVQYIGDDNSFVTFDDKQQFFDEICPLDVILEDMSYR